MKNGSYPFKGGLFSEVIFIFVQSSKKIELSSTFSLLVEKLRIKRVAFIAGKKNPAIQKIFIRFFNEIKLNKWFQR